LERTDRELAILDAINAAEKVRGQAFDALKSLELIDGARQTFLDSLEATRRQLSVTNDELRGQSRTIKDRVAWLIRELDRLAEQFKLLSEAPK
jgi:hypothetical protein